MRFKEYSYLTKDLPLKVVQNIIHDYHGKPVSLFNGDVVKFIDIGEENEIIVKLHNSEAISLDKRKLNIDYSFVPFPFYNEDLKSIYENQEKLFNIKIGDKVVTGESDSRSKDFGLYSIDIGGGQIVEIINVSIRKNGDSYYVEDILVKDQFGNEYDCYNLYWYDESKLGRNIQKIVNPISQLESSNFHITESNIQVLASQVTKYMDISFKNCPKFNNLDVAEILAESLIEFRNK